MRRARTLVAGCGAVALLLSACAGDGAAEGGPADATNATEEPGGNPSREAGETEGETSDGEPSEAESSDDQPAPATNEGATQEAALDFTARRVGGGTVEGQDFAGQPVVLWMWAPWCPRCNREAPEVADVTTEFEGEVTIIGVAGRDVDAEHEQFVERHGLEDMVHAIDEDGSLWAQYGVAYQPAWVFIDTDGTVDLHAGPLYGDLGDRIAEFLEP